MMKRGEFLSEEEKNEVEEISEVNVPRAPKKSSGILKRVAVFTLALAMTATAVFTMAGCGNTKDPPSSITTPVTPTPPDSTPIDPTPITPVDPPVKIIPTEKVVKLLDDMGTNYTYSFSSGNKDYNYYFDGDKVQIKNNKERISDYHYISGDKAYDLVYDKETGKWGRYDATGFDVNSLIMDSLRGAEWTNYDEIQNYFEGTVNGKAMTLYLDDEGGTLVGDDYYGCVSRIGETSVTLPTADKIYNADPTIDSTDPIEDTALYTIDANGNYVFNINAIQKAFMEITPNGNTLIDQVYKNCTILNDRIVENIVYINPTAESFQIGLLMHFDEAVYPDLYPNGAPTCLSIINDQNNKWKKFISNPENNTVSKFKDFLLTTSKPFSIDSTINQVKVEYTTIDEDYEAAHKEEFDKLTSIILETIATKGCKDTAVSDYRDQIVEFNNAKVLFGIKTPVKDTVAGLSLGYYKSWKQYYVLDVNGKLEFVDIDVASSLTNNVENEKENIYNKNYRWFLVYNVDRTDIDKNNELLYNTETKTQEKTQAKQVMFYEDKEREN